MAAVVNAVLFSQMQLHRPRHKPPHGLDISYGPKLLLPEDYIGVTRDLEGATRRAGFLSGVLTMAHVNT